MVKSHVVFILYIYCSFMTLQKKTKIEFINFLIAESGIKKLINSILVLFWLDPRHHHRCWDPIAKHMSNPDAAPF